MDRQAYELIGKVIDRAESLGFTKGDRFGHLMDVEYAYEVFEIDLDGWLKADDFDFMHDYIGIYVNIDRTMVFREKTSDAFNLFVPRFSRA